MEVKFIQETAGGNGVLPSLSPVPCPSSEPHQVPSPSRDECSLALWMKAGSKGAPPSALLSIPHPSFLQSGQTVHSFLAPVTSPTFSGAAGLNSSPFLHPHPLPRDFASPPTGLGGARCLALGLWAWRGGVSRRDTHCGLQCTCVVGRALLCLCRRQGKSMPRLACSSREDEACGTDLEPNPADPPRSAKPQTTCNVGMRNRCLVVSS